MAVSEGFAGRDMSKAMVQMMTATEPALRVAGFGFLFWAGFMLALDPDLVFGTARGWLPAVDEDAARIVGAGSLGAGMAAIQFGLVGRFPVAGRRQLANLAIHAGACIGLSVAAITIAEALGPLILAPDSPRLGRKLGDVIAANVLLLVFGLGLFAALLHFLHRRHAAQTPAVGARVPSHALRIPVQTRGGVLVVDAGDVDWIEAQGNYAALHVGRRTHVLRETLASLAERLDPARFVRIHRGAIVNLERIRRTRALRSGDAMVELVDGVELRASRTFAPALREKTGRSD